MRQRPGRADRHPPDGAAQLAQTGGELPLGLALPAGAGCCSRARPLPQAPGAAALTARHRERAHERSGPRTAGPAPSRCASAHHVARTWRMIRRRSRTLRLPSRQQAQSVQLPVSVLGMVGQQACRVLAGDPARHVHVDKFVFRHRIYCAGRGPVRIASALCLMLRSPPLPRYAPPPRRSRPRSTVTSRRSRRRSGEDDPAVYDAFNELAAAAEAYDELLYDRYDEVTPFEIPGADDSLPPYAGPEEPNALSVLIRRDYAVVEPQRLLAQAQRVAGRGRRRGRPGATAVAARCTAALGVLFGEFEPDEIASRHKEFGLEEGDSTLWVTAADERAGARRVAGARPSSRSIRSGSCCRFDVSSVFDEERTTSTTRTTATTRTSDDADVREAAGRGRADLERRPRTAAPTAAPRSGSVHAAAGPGAPGRRGRRPSLAPAARLSRPAATWASSSARQPGRARLRRDLGHRARQRLVHAVHHGQVPLAPGRTPCTPRAGSAPAPRRRAAPRPPPASARPTAWCAVSAQPCRTAAPPAPSVRRRPRPRTSRCSPSRVGRRPPGPGSVRPGAGE